MVYPGHGSPFKDVTRAISKSRRKARDYINHKEKTGADLLKKITIYTIMMHSEADEESFFKHLMGASWFKETVDLYFDGEYEEKYNEMMNDFLRRNIVKRKNGALFTTVKP